MIEGVAQDDFASNFCHICCHICCHMVTVEGLKSSIDDGCSENHPKRSDILEKMSDFSV